MELAGQTILITGSARRVGRAMALSAARAGAEIILHHGHSPIEAEQTAEEIRGMGRQVWTLQQDLSKVGVEELIKKAWEIHPLDALVNNAAIFESLSWDTTTRQSWQRHMDINLTAPFLLAQSFAKHLGINIGRIINILDWRALRPGADHFPYTISKAALAALTKSLAVALAPNITVNGIALGAILPPSDGTEDEDILEAVPAGRWASLDEVGKTLEYLLSGPRYTTGEIIHLDGGRHLI